MSHRDHRHRDAGHRSRHRHRDDPVRLRRQRRHRLRRDGHRRHQGGHDRHPEPGGRPDAAWRSCPASCRGSGADRRHRYHRDEVPKDGDHPDGDRRSAHRWEPRCARGAAPDAACPGWARTGCCPDAGCRRPQDGRYRRCSRGPLHPGDRGRHRDGACPGWSRTGCCPDAGCRHRDGHHGRRHGRRRDPDARSRARQPASAHRAWAQLRASAHQAWDPPRAGRTPRAPPGSRWLPEPGRVPPARGSEPESGWEPGRAPGSAWPRPGACSVPEREPESGSTRQASVPRASRRPAWVSSQQAWRSRPCRTGRHCHRRGTCRACAARRAARASKTPSERIRLPTSARQAGSCFPLRALLRARRRGL